MKIFKRALTVEFIRRVNLLNIILILLITLLPSCKNKNKERSEEELMKMAQNICETNIIIDSHIDWPEWIVNVPEDISGQTSKGDFDLVRANKGGLNAALSVIYISSDYNVDEGRTMVDSLLKLITYYPKTYPDKFAIARNPYEVKKNFSQKLFSLPLCLENGSPIGNEIEYLKHLKDLGIVYLTLCHNKTNQISDSNFDTIRKWNGLSPFGYEVIKELNQLGIMIDISHSTDSTVFQSLRFSKAPIIATHSSCRYFIPGFERNLSDTLIKAIAQKNGVVMVNFGSMFLDSICLKNCNEAINWMSSNRVDMYSKEGTDFLQEFVKTHKVVSNSKELVDHIDHIIKIAGINYVGLGSDFDGIGPTQPSDIPDVSGYPVIVFELLKRGYSEKDIKKILSGNFLRVWNDVIAIADSINKASTD
jgi:membrane dipeptidase